MLYVKEYGVKLSKTVIVLIPGIISTHDYWRNTIAKLDKKHRIISLDLIGFGASPKPYGCDYSLDAHTIEVRKSLESLNLPHGYVLVGHSFGAMIALRLAKENPKKYKKVIISGLPLIDSETGPKQLAEIARCPEAIVQGPAGWVNAYGVWLTGPVVRLFIHKLFKDMPAHVMRDTTRSAPWAFMRSVQTMTAYNPKSDIANNKHPTTFIFGSQDTITEGLAKKLGKLPDNYTVRYYDCDHQIPLRAFRKLADEIQR